METQRRTAADARSRAQTEIKAMSNMSIFEAQTRDGQLARALNVSLHALVVHSGMHATSEGEEIELDFTAEIAQVQEALALPGVGREETLPYLAPHQVIEFPRQRAQPFPGGTGPSCPAFGTSSSTARMAQTRP